VTKRTRTPLRPPVLGPPKALPAAQKESAEATARASYQQSPSRAGRRGVTFYLQEDEWKELRRLSLDLDVPIQALMTEAVELLLVKHKGKG